MTRIMILFGALIGLVGVGCGDNPGGGGMDGGTPDLTEPTGPPIEIACADTIDSIYADPGTLPADKGAIIRCAKDKYLSASQLNTMLLADVPFTARAVTNGSHAYRVLYRTERGTVPPTAGYSSALVLLPDTPRATKLPVVVASHGSRGQCPTCAASKEDPFDVGVNPDFERQVYTLVGYGYAVMVPDLAGYANYGATGNPPSAYDSADDVGKSTLDGARALRKLIPSLLTDKVVLVGHSQGGFTALSAAALFDSYGADGTLAAVATYAPTWITQRSYGAITALPGAFPFMGSEGANAISIWYHYTHGELLDGPGHGGDVFLPAKRAAIKDFVDNAGWYSGTPPWATLYALGSTATDIYDPSFTNAIGQYAAGFAADCPTDSTGPLCQTWKARYLADRPHLTATEAMVPNLLLWGDTDTSVPPERITCAIDRLKGDGVALTVCVAPGVDHGGVVGAKADYVGDWIAAQTLGATMPAACAQNETSIMSSGMLATCATIPPND